MTHGHTAKVLTLPDENPDLVKVQASAWRDTCQPEGHDEETLVDHLAVATVRLERLTKAEDAVIDDQVRRAEVDWDYTQEILAVKASWLLRDYPAKALVELKSFGAGVSWLLAGWIELAETFHASDSWSDLESIHQALRFLGHKPLTLGQESLEAQDFAATAISCLRDPEIAQKLAKAMGFVVPETWRSRYRVEDAVRTIRQQVSTEIARLKALDAVFTKLDAASRAEASIRALVPMDTAQNRLMLRYRQSAQSTFERSLRALQKLQSDRQKAVEAEAKEAQNVAFPNEATVVGRTRSKQMGVGSCITIKGAKYEVAATCDGNLVLSPWLEAPEPTVLGVVPAPEDGV
jgi:hypothetical protein